MTLEDCRALFDYDAWANERALAATAALTPEQFTGEMGGSFRSVRDTWMHIFGAQWLWLERFHGRTPSALAAPESFPDVAAVREHGAEIGRGLRTYIGGLSAENLAGVFEYRTLKGTTFQNPLGQVLQHLANHGTYHRGQITTLLRQLGVKPAGTDLIGYYREQAAGK